MIVDHAIFLLDPRGGIRTWNAGAERLHGYRAEEIVGQSTALLYAPEDRARGLPEQLLEHTRAQGRVEHEGWLPQKHGGRFWGNTVLTAIRDAKGGIRGFAQVTRDVTDRRRLEENARRLWQEQAARAAAEQALALAERVRDRTARLQALTSALAKALTPPQVAEAALGEGLGALGAFAGAIYLVRQEGGEVESLRAAGMSHVGVPPERFSVSERNPIADAIRAAEPIYLASLAELEARYPEWGKAASSRTEALAAVPLVVEGQAIGAFSLRFLTRQAFDQDDRTYIGVLAQQCAQALARARLFEAERRARADAQMARFASERAAELAMQLQKITAALSEAPTVARVSAVILGELRRVHGAERAAVWLLGDTPWLELADASGFSADQGPRPRIDLESHCPEAEAIRTGEVQWLRGHGQLSRYPELAVGLPQQASSRSLVAVPLLAARKPVGVLSIQFDESRRSGWAERSFLVLLAGHCAEALARARLYEVERATRAAAEASRERLAFLASSLDYDTTLKRVARLAIPVLADWCRVDLVGEGGALRCAAYAHSDAKKLRELEQLVRSIEPDPEGRYGISKVARTLRPELGVLELGRIGAVPDHVQRLTAAVGLSTTLVVPLVVRGRVLGTLTLARMASGQKYGPEDVALAEELARRAATAVDNALLYHQAQTAISVRDEFLSIAGHELKTPLTAANLQLASLERLVRKCPPDLAERLPPKLESMQRQGKRLQKLIEQLLDVSRITAGKLAFELEELDLAELTREILARFTDEAARAGSTVSLVAPTPVIGKWDRIRLDQVITNLVSNAIKYGSGKPIDVEVSAAPEGARLVVRDQGIGIAPDQQARIFGRFERAVSERNYGGFGLGLWIARQLIEGHDGTIQVESQPGAGATFTVILPRSSRAEEVTRDGTRDFVGRR